MGTKNGLVCWESGCARGAQIIMAQTCDDDGVPAIAPGYIPESACRSNRSSDGLGAINRDADGRLQGTVLEGIVTRCNATRGRPACAQAVGLANGDGCVRRFPREHYRFVPASALVTRCHPFKPRRVSTVPAAEDANCAFAEDAEIEHQPFGEGVLPSRHDQVPRPASAVLLPQRSAGFRYRRTGAAQTTSRTAGR